MLRGGGGCWRQHVRAELRRRERRARGLRGLVQRHVELQERMAAQQERMAERLRQDGEASGPPADLVSLHVQLELEAVELRRQREELRQQVALLTDVLREAEAENQEQRTRMGRLAHDLAALTHQYEEVQCKAWILSQEAEGLRQELEQARGLLQDTQRERLDLEARWVREKVEEAVRVNRANEQEEKYRRKVIRLREKLEKAREAAGCVPRLVVETAPGDESSSLSPACKAVGLQVAGIGQAGSSPPGHAGTVPAAAAP
ncbi:autophagy-related protein 16-like [Elgaria multicarinata webbii]|uniref:autophagy-related protein 16-like n=1 Tax=Elgaria multicarinata webbii TaxID=159646 RepID=UPI002FCD43F1